ncbi:MAG: hypothetical protein V4621_05020 [Pseudomonadota bacterium]
MIRTLLSALLLVSLAAFAGPALAQDAPKTLVDIKSDFVPVAHCAYDKGNVQLDVFYEDGVHTFCGETVPSTTTGHAVFVPVYTPKTFVSWEEHACAKDGKLQVPEAYRARCVLRQYMVEKGTFCKRDGDMDADGFVDGLKNVPVSMADILGAFMIGGRGAKAYVTLKGTDIDTGLAKPAYWPDIGNIALPYDVHNPIGVIARSYMMPRPHGTAGGSLVVHDRQTDLLRNTYLSQDDIRQAGTPIEIGPCLK